MREYVGGDFSLFDALDMDQGDFKKVFVVASAKNMAELARIKKAKQKRGS